MEHSLTIAPVVCFRWDHPTNTTTRIGNITVVSRDDVNMGVRDCLASGLAVVHSNVETVWMKFCFELLSNLSNNTPQLAEFLGREIKDADDVTNRDNQRVPVRNWIRVTKSAHGGRYRNERLF
jgi:hypothetical protein